MSFSIAQIAIRSARPRPASWASNGTFGFMRETTLPYGELNAMFAERERR